MAFVPGRKHDLFLSYAHNERVWADALVKALRKEFQERTGREVTFWQDSHKLRVGQDWHEEIEAAIRNAAVFVAIVSPSYLTSTWCGRERDLILENGIEALKVESPIEAFYRFLKIVKMPDDDGVYEELLEGLQDFRFFNEADRDEIPRNSAEFIAKIRDLFREIRDLLTLMSNQAQELYLAPGSIEIEKQRAELERELADRGFAIQPEVVLGAGFGKGSIRNAMDQVSHVIFVLGTVFDKFAREQIAMAQDLGKPALFWVQPGPRREDMIKRIHDLGESPAGSEILGGRSIRELIPQLLEKLRPNAPEPAALNSGMQRVYVNYDATLPGDARIGGHIAGIARERKLDVVESGRGNDHDRLMQISNGVLLIRSANPTPDQWLNYNATELALSARVKQPDFAAKGLLIFNPGRVPAQAAGLPVYPYSEPFQPETLNPFFDGLAKARSADGRQ